MGMQAGYWGTEEEGTEGQDGGQQQAPQQQAPQQQAPQQQEPSIAQVVQQSIAQAMAPIQQGQAALANQMGFLQRKIDTIEKKGGQVSPELQGQLDQVAKAVEEQRLADMTQEEQLAYWRTKASSERPQAPNQNDSTGEDDPDLDQLARSQYPTVEKRMERQAKALGLPFNDALKGELRKIQVNADRDGNLQWDEWEDTAAGYLDSVAKWYEQQATQQSNQQTPAQQAGRSLGGNSRPGGPSAPSEPDFFTSSVEDSIKYSQERAKTERRR